MDKTVEQRNTKWVYYDREREKAISDFKAALKEEINVEIMKWQHDAGYCGGLQKALTIIDTVNPKS